MIASSENQALMLAGFGNGSTGETASPPGVQSAVWSMTGNPAYNRLRWQGYPAFLSDAQMARLDRIFQARMLFRGRHREYYLTHGRTAFDFPYVKSNGASQRMYLTYNVLGLISIKGSDLLFSQSPLLDCDDDNQWDALQALVRRTQLHAVLLDGSIIGSAEGEAYFEAMIHTDSQVYVRQVDNEQIFPVGDVGPDGQYGSYVRYDSKNIGTPDTPIWLLLETTIAAGSITRVCWQLGDRFQKLKQVDLKYFDTSLVPVTQTGIAQNTITWVPNVRGLAVSEYDCALELQDALNAVNTQISRVVQKHSDPRIALPRQMADPQGNVPAAAEAFFYDDPNVVPKYITWDAQLALAIQHRAFTLNQLLVRTETSPVLLGLKDGSAPDAYKKVRLEAFNSINKAARRSIIWTAAVQRVIAVAQALDCTRPGVGYSLDPVGVTLRDGIPVDEGEQATNIATLRSAGVLSRRRAVQMQLGDEAAVDAEMAELDKEQAAATPSVLLGTNAGADMPPAPATAPPEPGDPHEHEGDDAPAGKDDTEYGGAD
ncbi:MAG TPA: hypothetical protein VHQ47_17705 [Phycisphaerae bacterium]|jgi:hypothetical protein|nr:hypothetical protein [Phycisphaerae bacterium]